MTLEQLITHALKEDIGEGDHTSQACIPGDVTGKAQLLIKEEGILAGVEFAQLIFHKVDPELKIEVFLRDGANVKNGDVAFIIEGRSRSILKAERVALNFMQRMSGIATTTHDMVQSLQGTNTKILDTRKTTPGLRVIEKWAVRIGGGVNHRFGLDDMIMIKDNHIDMSGGIKNAISSVHSYLKKINKDLEIVIEARGLKEVKEILLTGGINRIMLDNFSPTNLQQAVKLIDGKFKTEASGGITGKNIRDYAECGVDYISIGALTHSVKSLDMSLKVFLS
ncbi:MAG: carboxylating nicotinate-nucleotide diphosphorylase [Bacteroidota bacterium]